MEGRSTDRNPFDQLLQLSELGPDAHCCCSSLSWGRMPIVAIVSISIRLGETYQNGAGGNRSDVVCIRIALRLRLIRPVLVLIPHPMDPVSR